jgi:hypothetical protein
VRSRLLPAVLGLLAVVGVGAGLFVVAMFDWLRPDPAPAAVVERDAPPPRAPLLRRSAVSGTPDPGACPIDVRVEGPDHLPEPDVRVTLALDVPGHLRTRYDEVRTDADGRVSWPDVACGEYRLHAQADGLAGSERYGENKPGSRASEVLRLTEGRDLAGQVVDLEGEPVPGASVQIGASHTEADARGRFRIVVADTSLTVQVESFGYEDAYENWPLTEGGDLVDDFEIQLRPEHQVRVHCAGRPDDSCKDMHLLCTEPLLPFGQSCNDRKDVTICSCPAGEVAIRGGSRSVLVAEDETEAWLDFTDTGRITGVVTLDGEPTERCSAHAIRIPNGLEDLPRGLVSATRTQCDAEGRFSFEGVPAGDWEVLISLWAGGEEHRMNTLPQRVRARRTTDLGVLDLRDGGGIEGLLVDGLTGEPMRFEPVLALRMAEGKERTTPMGADSDGDGVFHLKGLPPGRWRLAHPLSPHEYTEVIVEDGAITDGIEVRTSDATALDHNGFDLAHLEDELLVEDVEEGSPADRAGLLPGDRITGIQIAGFDLSGLPGGVPAEATRAVLAHYDGPGVTLIVDRPGAGAGDTGMIGGPIEVPLEW